MRTSLLLLAVLTTAAWAPALTGAAKIVLVGDSTVAEDGGWGPGFRASFDATVETLNHAMNGRSSKSFRAEKRWEPALAAHPDYVLIQFGHNDGPGKGPERETDAATTFRDNLRRYAAEARAAGATPVLVTSIVRRSFNADGSFRPDTLVPYVEAVRAVAAERQLPLIDLYALTRAQAERLGNAGCESTIGAVDAAGKPDHTHLSPRGKAEIGAMVARELARLFPAFAARRHELVSWRQAMRQPQEWYGGAEAIRIADNLLLYQHENGGWEKNLDMALPVAGKHLEQVRAARTGAETTIDNDATYTQMRFLGRVWAATRTERFAAAASRGLEYLLAAQYPNGGWPQFYPLRHGYWDHITYNDDAMVGVLQALRSIAAGEPEFAFVAAPHRERARRAMEKGIDCILRTQVMVEGRPAVWCAQHDEKTLAPAQARAYELPSLSGGESVGVAEFLMGIERPPAAVVRAVQGAVAWFSRSRITGIRVVVQPAPGTPKGVDRVVVEDRTAPPLWARFYELGTNRPFFCGRDGVAKYSLAEIEYERRNGYRWYVDRPGKLLERDYPAWRAKWGVGEDARVAK
jgi:PelA/Pel-15E family pectate lyase